VNPAVIFFAITAAVGVAIITGLWREAPGFADKYAAKLSRIDDHTLTLEEIELSRPFSERFLIPVRDWILKRLIDRTPAGRIIKLQELIVQAGRPMGATVSSVMVAKVICAVIAGVAAIALLFFLPLNIPGPLRLLGGVAARLGWALPDQWLKQKAGQRRRLIEDSIPDTIDLFTICLDAGLSFDAAMQRLAEKLEGPLQEELQTTLAEIRYGRPRSEALESLATRVAADDLTVFLSAVVQSQKLGVSLGETVRIQAAEIRRRRREKAEEQASQASLKMLFPMIGCIFPTLFIVLMGPVALVLLARK
jgi:tight adherence protein C